MAFGFFKRLAAGMRPRVRRGVVAFREGQWDAPPNTPLSKFVESVKARIRVVDVRRAGGMVRVTCDCDQFEPVDRFGPFPQYLPGCSMQFGPDGETYDVTFKRHNG